MPYRLLAMDMDGTVLNSKKNITPRTEEAGQAALDEVKQSRVRFRSASAAKMQEQRDKLDGKNEPETAGQED